jgi:hypothetical protein
MNRNKHNRSFLLLVYACPKVPTHRVVDKNTENNIEIIIKIEIGYIFQGQIKKKNVPNLSLFGLCLLLYMQCGLTFFGKR